MLKQIVNKSNYKEVIELLSQEQFLVADVETTNLTPYRDNGVMFAMVIACEKGCYYFHFDEGEDVPEDVCLDIPEVWEALRKLFSDPTKTIGAHHATFDLGFLHKEKIFVAGKIHDSKTCARLIWNQHFSFSLKDVCKRDIGLDKSSAVEEYIKEHKLYTDVESPHKNTKERKLHFDKVPFDIISQYTLTDGEITYKLMKHQMQMLTQMDTCRRKSTPPIKQVYDLECALVPAVFEMERVGIKVDHKYCLAAIDYEELQASKAVLEFRKLTGRDFIDSNKLFGEVLVGVEVPLTPKGKPSYDKASLAMIKDNPIAECILSYREAKKQVDYFHSFIHYSDKDHVVHPNLTRDGTVTGRFSSSHPNFQNQTRTEKGGDGYEVRGALIPRDGFSFYSLDYSQQELRLMLDLAGAVSLCGKIKAGEDPHQATADLVKISRQEAKTLNFALIYSAGPNRIAEMLKITPAHAKDLRTAYFKNIPEVQKFIAKTTSDAEDYKEVRDWYGRIFRFPDRNDCYRACNHKIQGGSASICKIAIVNCFEFLKNYKSRMVLTIHDSILAEIAFGEEHILPTLKKLMIDAYPYKLLPMDVSVEYAPKNMSLTEKVVI